MAKEINTIGVLTSGGDAPGMNAAIRAVVRTALAQGKKVKGIMRGYQGLLDEEIIDMDKHSVSDIIQKGGTILGTARSADFRTAEGQQKGAEICKKHHLIINAEGIGHSASMAKRIEAATGMETRATILGHMQRGGSPSCKDRVYASIMGAYAVDALCEGKSSRVVAYKNGEYIDIDIDEALAMHKDISDYEFNISKVLAR